MLSSIHPFGERSRNNTFAVTAAAYLVGSVLGGATTGALAGAIGTIVDPAPRLALAAVAVMIGVGLAADLGIAGLGVPSWRRQVNERWLDTYRGWVVGLGFGFQLGLGVVTIVTTSAVWSTWVAAAATGSFGAAVGIGIVFGAVRGSFIVMAARVHAPSDLRALHRRLAATGPLVARATLAVVAAAATAAVIGLVAAP